MDTRAVVTIAAEGRPAPAPPAITPVGPQKKRCTPCAVWVCLCAVAGALTIALCLGLLLRNSLPPTTFTPALPTATLSTPAASLTAPLANALRCDVARALEPLGVTLAQIILTTSVSTEGALLPISAADPANTNGTCAAPPTLRRGLSQHACAVPLSQQLSSVTLRVDKALRGDDIDTALATMAFTSERRGGGRPALPTAHTAHPPHPPPPQPLTPPPPHRLRGCLLKQPLPAARGLNDPQLPRPLGGRRRAHGERHADAHAIRLGLPNAQRHRDRDREPHALPRSPVLFIGRVARKWHCNGGFYRREPVPGQVAGRVLLYTRLGRAPHAEEPRYPRNVLRYAQLCHL